MSRRSNVIIYIVFAMLLALAGFCSSAAFAQTSSTGGGGDMTTLIIGVLLAAIPGLVGAGALHAKVTRLEGDLRSVTNRVDGRVDKELFELHMKRVEERLQSVGQDATEVKQLLLTLFARRATLDDTSPGVNRG